MRVLVVGGCGFIGSHLVNHLMTVGHGVVVLDPRAQPTGCPWPGITHLRASFLQGRVLEEALDGTDIVYHLATSTSPLTSQVNPSKDIEDNLVGMVKFMDVMRRSPCRRIVYFSSGGTVYGNSKKDLVSEDDELNPICAYGVVKVAIEKYLGMCSHNFGLHPIILRPANIYGARQRHAGAQGLIAACLSNVLKGLPIEIWGDGLAVRDYVHVEDLVRLACVAGESTVKHGSFNVGSGVGVTVNAILDLVREVTEHLPDTVYRPERQFDVRHIVLSNDLSRRTFGWEPQVSLRDGIAGVYAHLVQRAVPG